MMRIVTWAMAWLSCGFVATSIMAEQPGLLSQKFIYETAPFPSAHASTIAQATDGTLVSAWFGGTKEGHQDVEIWVSRLVDDQCSAPVSVADGVQTDGTRMPCWNPVLFQPKDGPLHLYYKVGPTPSTWWGMLRTSDDAGKTWSEPIRLEGEFVGPIKNKPVQLADGTIIAPSSAENYQESPKWRIHFEVSPDAGKNWMMSKPAMTSESPDTIQPSLLIHADGKVQAIGRTKAGKVFSTFSNDQGKSWSEVTLLELPNPNSGTDAVTMKDGRHVLIYNHTRKGRTPLSLAVSNDGIHWQAAMVLESEPGEYSYPAIIQTNDGMLHATYTWKRQRVKHAVIDPSKLTLKPIVNGVWPAE